MSVEMFIQHLTNALSLGALYGLIAIGYTMVYGILRLINFAHGDIFMLGAYMVFFLTISFMPVWVAFALALLAVIGIYTAMQGFSKKTPLWFIGICVVLLAGTVFFLYQQHEIASQAAAFIAAGGSAADAPKTPDFRPPWVLAVVFAIGVTSAIGILVDRVAYRPLRDAPRISALISAIGVSFLIENAGVVIFTGMPKPVVQPEALVTPILAEVQWLTDSVLAIDRVVPIGPAFKWAFIALLAYLVFLAGKNLLKKNRVWAKVYNVACICVGAYLIVTLAGMEAGKVVATGKPVRIIPLAVLVPIASFALVLGLLFIIYRTKPGLAMRAISRDIETTRLMGVNVNRVIALTFGLGSALAAAAGIMWALRYPQIHPYMGILPGFKAFIAAVFGGIGSIQGAMLGGLLLGFIEIMIIAFFPTLSGYRDAFAFVLLIVILLKKPTGLLGEKLEEKI